MPPAGPMTETNCASIWITTDLRSAHIPLRQDVPADLLNRRLPGRLLVRSTRRGIQNRRFCRAVRAFHTSVLSEHERQRSGSLEQLVLIILYTCGLSLCRNGKLYIVFAVPYNVERAQKNTAGMVEEAQFMRYTREWSTSVGEASR